MSIWNWISGIASAAENTAPGLSSHEPTMINPTTNLPMIGGANIDVAGNPLGTNSNHGWDQHNAHHGGLSGGYDPTRGW